jgi:hypothetical protein
MSAPLSEQVVALIGIGAKERRLLWSSIADRIPNCEFKQDVEDIIDANTKGAMMGDSLRLLAAWLEGYEAAAAVVDEMHAYGVKRLGLRRR